METIFRSSPHIILLSLLFLFILTRNYLVFRMGIYFLLAELLTVILKRVGKKLAPNSPLIYRPKNGGHCTGCKVNPIYSKECIQTEEGIGMPSGHSLGATFIATFVILFLLRRGGKMNILASCVIAFYALGIVLSRTSLGQNCHTPLQVTVGGIIGIIFGFACFKFDSFFQ
jgi:membrane-associated phospholipid phosphatase